MPVVTSKGRKRKCSGSRKISKPRRCSPRLAKDCRSNGTSLPGKHNKFTITKSLRKNMNHVLWPFSFFSCLILSQFDDGFSISPRYGSGDECASSTSDQSCARPKLHTNPSCRGVVRLNVFVST